MESTVQQPQLYMFTRSRSSIKDQALYTPTRVEHIMELSKSRTECGNVEYESIMRFGIGEQLCNISFPFLNTQVHTLDVKVFERDLKLQISLASMKNLLFNLK